MYCRSGSRGNRCLRLASGFAKFASRFTVANKPFVSLYTVDYSSRLYCLAVVFENFNLNTTLFIIFGEVFRSATVHAPPADTWSHDCQHFIISVRSSQCFSHIYSKLHHQRDTSESKSFLPRNAMAHCKQVISRVYKRLPTTMWSNSLLPCVL